MVTGGASRLNDLLDYFVCGSFQNDPEVQRQAKRVAAFAIAFVFWIFAFGGLIFALGAPQSGLVVVVTALPIACSLWAVKRGYSPTIAGNLICTVGWLALTILALLNGGSTAAVLLWYSTLPVVAVLTAGFWWGAVWTFLPIASLAVLAVAPKLVLADEMPPANRLVFGGCVLAGLIACQFVLAWVRVGVEQRALAALHETNLKLRIARETLASLEAGFGFSLEAWTKLQREKAALERYVRLQCGDEAAQSLQQDAEIVARP